MVVLAVELVLVVEVVRLVLVVMVVKEGGCFDY